MTDAAHTRSILVWDVPSAVRCGEDFAIKVGLKCEDECPAEGWALEVRDHDGATIAGAEIGNEAWPDTAALYFTEVALRAPEVTGQFAWEVVAPPIVGEAENDGTETGHAESRTAFNVRIVPEADHRLTVIAINRETQQPVAGLKVVVHPYRAVTDEQGVAELSLPTGRYRVFVSGKEFSPFRVDGELMSDQTIRAELDIDRGPTDAETWS